MNKSFHPAAILSLVVFVAPGAQADYSFTTIDYPDVSYSATFGISNAGHLVGEYQNAFGVYHGYLLKGGAFESFDYPDPGSVGTSALGVNSLGDVVGVSGDFFGNTSAFRRIGDSYTPIVPSDNSTYTQANNINDVGHVVGSYYTGGVDRGFLFDGTTYTTGLNAPGAQHTVALGVNNLDSIVGTYTTPAGVRHGFVRNGTTYTKLDYPGMSFTVAYGINDSGQIAGFYRDALSNSHGFLLSGGVYTTIDAPGATMAQVRGIDNAGHLAGYFEDANGTHGFLAVPTLDGDFNGDGTVDAPDYAVWRKNSGGNYTPNDYDIWRANFGATPGAGSGTALAAPLTPAVPEPIARWLFTAGFVALIAMRRFRTAMAASR